MYSGSDKVTKCCLPACLPLRIAESEHVVVFKEHFNGLLTRLHPHTRQCYCLHSLKESHQTATSLCLNCAWWYIANSQVVRSLRPLCHSRNNFSVNLRSCTVHVDSAKSFICPTNAHKLL